MNEFGRLQDWYKLQCDGNWEQQHGISIISCDNPAWWVKIDLEGTPLEFKPFTTLARNTSTEQMDRIAKGLESDPCDRGSDWMLCEVKEKKFDGAGDPDKLSSILDAFLKWAEI